MPEDTQLATGPAESFIDSVIDGAAQEGAFDDVKPQPTEPAEPKPTEPKPDEKPTETATEPSKPEPKATAKPDEKPDLPDFGTKDVSDANRDQLLSDAPDTVKNSPSKSEQWATLKREKIDAVRRAEELETRMRDMGDVRQLREENQRLSDRLKQLDIQSHPEFVAKYDRPFQTKLNILRQIAGEHSDRLISAIQQGGKAVDNALSELGDDLGEFQRTRAAGVINDIAEIQIDRESALSEWKNNYEQLQRQSQEEQRHAEEQYSEALANIWNEAETSVDILTDSDVAKTVRERAEYLLSTRNDPKSLSKALVWASMAPSFLQDISAKSEEIDALKTRLAELEKAAPKPKSSDSSSTDTGEDDYSKMSPVDAILARAAKGGAIIQ